MKPAAPPSLRERQKAATRGLILDTALELFHGGEVGFSHETIAERSGVSARTVYRYFPSQAKLYLALWQRIRDLTETRFPTTEGDLLPLVHQQFRQFERHAPLVRAGLTSPASAEIMSHGWEEGHAAFQKALAEVTAGLPEEEGRWLVAVCQSIYSAPFWQMLRTRGRLSGDAAAKAAAWAIGAVLVHARGGRVTSDESPTVEG
jgi:AcrR family transcriptional regulator